jgi:hypothetical protein
MELGEVGGGGGVRCGLGEGMRRPMRVD